MIPALKRLASAVQLRPAALSFQVVTTARNVVFQGWEQYGNIQEPVAALSPPSPSISLHISRAVFPVFAMCCFPSLA